MTKRSEPYDEKKESVDFYRASVSSDCVCRYCNLFSESVGRSGTSQGNPGKGSLLGGGGR